ncbi:DUF6506 family protein [Oceanimonas pelagia]|uniref:DUF6506 family protein n=1 Tax=Oceanimonas pelagia TaxID=3028314 RepID=A0AA50KPX7_9GAMM|nr:DUF6506 family protein [Oceanimonas pelagia]WMC10977.1 DUF6506 family protein [Oceanimonas pelagia]
MRLSRYGFIVKAPDLELFKHHGRIKSEGFDLAVSGVSTLEEAIMAAQEMLTRRIELIELCGGFTAEEEAAIREAINDHVPLGRAVTRPEDQDRVQWG